MLFGAASTMLNYKSKIGFVEKDSPHET